MVLLCSAMSLLIFCLPDLSISNRGVLKSPGGNCGLVYFSLQFYQFFLHQVWGSVAKCIRFYDHHHVYIQISKYKAKEQ